MYFRLVITTTHGGLRLTEQTAINLAKDIADSEGIGCTVEVCSVDDNQPVAEVSARGVVTRVQR